jgi:hypothetical protein
VAALSARAMCRARRREIAEAEAARAESHDALPLEGGDEGSDSSRG